MDRAATSVLTLVVTTTVFLIALRRLQRANERLLESQVELEKTVAERTQSLVERVIRRSGRRARR